MSLDQIRRRIGLRTRLRSSARFLTELPYQSDLQRRVAPRISMPGAHSLGSFEEIAETSVWGGSESLSGYGSDLGATVPLRADLAQALDALAIQSFVDAPCGDLKRLPPFLDLWARDSHYRDKRIGIWRGVDLRSAPAMSSVASLGGDR